MAQITVEQAFQTALRLHQAGQLPQAESVCTQILARQPNHADALHLLGVIVAQTGRNDMAVDLIRRAIALQPDIPEAYANLGVALRGNGQLDEAIAVYRQAIALNASVAETHSNLGNALREKGQLDEAIAACRRAIALKGDLPAAHTNLGNALSDQGQLDEAIAAHRRAIALKGDWSKAYYNLAVALKDNGQLNEAIAAYGRAIARAPQYPEARFNLAVALLLKGEFAEGWSEYEWRWKCPGFTTPAHLADKPRWDGSDSPGRTIVVYAEQGLGDSLQFVRYVPMIARRGLRVIVEAPAPLLPVLRTVEGVAEVRTGAASLPPIDVRIPMLSLPFVFGTTLNNIPADVPYLKAARRWDDGVGKGLKVGLCWAGNPQNIAGRSRSTSLAALAPLAAVAGITFYSLQKGDAAGQAAHPPAGLNLIDWTDQINDFGDTAALVSCLDLVISVDTAVAHLAGGMGKPVWLLLPYVPDFRWLLERANCPWYPTMRIFRQPARMQWAPVVEAVVAQLARLVTTGSW